jgi:hypothetical protein
MLFCLNEVSLEIVTRRSILKWKDGRKEGRKDGRK